MLKTAHSKTFQHYNISTLQRNTVEENILKDYTERASYAAQQAIQYKKLADTYSLYRLGVFGLFILGVAVAISLNEMTIIVLAFAALVICFSWLVKKQSGFDRLNTYWLDIKKVNENEIASILESGNMYPDGAGFANDKHYYTSDLDIFGGNSLYQLINRAATAAGMLKLAQWLAKPADKAAILSRQEAIKEIAAKNDWKIEFQAYLLFCLKQNREQVKNLLGYLKIPVDLEDAKWLKIYSQVAPWLLLVLIIASIFYLPARYAAPLLALANYRLVSSKGDRIKKADLIAGKIGATLAHFSSAFKVIEEQNWQTSYNQALYSKIRPGNGENISAKIEELSRLIDKLNYRLNLLVGFVLNVFLLWDIRQIIAIEKWKKNNRQNFDTAFDALAEFEALVSLSSLAVNYPGWCTPEIIDSEAYTLVAKGLGHPLIGVKKRVENDFALDNTYQIDIITGSNMAGKSTFLRTVGINTVMALCGGPVCAKEMKVSVMTILSYMRIKDSLNESTSTFKAEIDRLQMLLKAVEGEEKIYFLIDEMLRGTNSADKYLGSKAVIERLIAKKAVGIVATHDLQIAELEKSYPEYIRNFYFDIQVKNGEMLFDYKIKDGECKTFNASLLLEQIGIHVNEAGEPKSKNRG
jgi:hypothetical protein